MTRRVGEEVNVEDHLVRWRRKEEGERLFDACSRRAKKAKRRAEKTNLKHVSVDEIARVNSRYWDSVREGSCSLQNPSSPSRDLDEENVGLRNPERIHWKRRLAWSWESYWTRDEVEGIDLKQRKESSFSKDVDDLSSSPLSSIPLLPRTSESHPSYASEIEQIEGETNPVQQFHSPPRHPQHGFHRVPILKFQRVHRSRILKEVVGGERLKDGF